LVIKQIFKFIFVVIVFKPRGERDPQNGAPQWEGGGIDMERMTTSNVSVFADRLWGWTGT
jgi:hypothetical protein